MHIAHADLASDGTVEEDNGMSVLVHEDVGTLAGNTSGSSVGVAMIDQVV